MPTHQKIPEWNKNSTTNRHGGLANCSWARSLLCSKVDMPSLLHWRKLTSSPSRYQLQVASCLGRDILSPSPFLSWYCCLAWICTKFVHTATVSGSSYSYRSCSVWKTLFFQSLTSFDSYSLSVSSAVSSPEPWWEKVDESIPFRTACCNISHSLSIVRCVSVLIPS